MDGASRKMKLGMIKYTGKDSLDEATDLVVQHFNEMQAADHSMYYLDMHIQRGYFGRVFIVLMYACDDTLLEAETLPPAEEMPAPVEAKQTYLGMMPGLDPSDPEWREKQAAWQADIDGRLF